MADPITSIPNMLQQADWFNSHWLESSGQNFTQYIAFPEDHFASNGTKIGNETYYGVNVIASSETTLHQHASLYHAADNPLMVDMYLIATDIAYDGETLSANFTDEMYNETVSITVSAHESRYNVGDYVTLRAKDPKIEVQATVR